MKQWDFTLSGGNGTVEMHVDPRSGHWSQVLDTNTFTVTRTVYVYEAEFVNSDGERWQGPVLSTTLRLLRKKHLVNAGVSV